MIGRLLMHRDGVVNSAADPRGSQRFPQSIVLGQPDHKLMKYMRRL
jgi:hypothetical protein